MTQTGKGWEFPHGFRIVEEHIGYALTCNGNFVAYSASLGSLLWYLGKQLNGENNQ